MRQRFRVLVIDDEPDTLQLLRLMLAEEGFDVSLAQDALAGLRMAYQTHPDAILLDVMMPNIDGFEVCRRLREMTDAAIIFITAMGTIEDVVQGFSVGADDYVVKPYNRADLVSRLRACLRRTTDHSNEEGEVIFVSPSLLLDCGRHELITEKGPVYLTPKEFGVFRLLVRHAGRVISTDAILSQIWGPERIGDPDLVKQYIYQLRQKIEPDSDSPRYIHTVRGEGYFFDAEGLR